MRLSRLTPANDIEVRKWMSEALSLSAYQKEMLYSDDVVREGPYTFYKEADQEVVKFWWRFTIFLVPAYVILIWITMLLKFLVTGNQYLWRKFLDHFHYPWMRKLKIHL